jgi:hypothetical protein
MPFQICIKTGKTLQQLAAEICDLFSLPSYKLDPHTEEPYCQFEMLGMILFIRPYDEESRDPEVRDYTYCLDLQLSFIESDLDTDVVEYSLQPYYAQLLAFRLNIETACYEKRQIGQHWQIRYRYYAKNERWKGDLLFGEEGYAPAIKEKTPSAWRSMHTLF